MDLYKPTSTTATEKTKEKGQKRLPIQIAFPELFRSDVSIYPSYTHFKLPYSVVCRQRYHNNKFIYHKQFLKELESMEMLQDRAIKGVRIHRVFSNGFKFPTIKEMPDPFTPSERQIVQDILENRRGLY